jgi:hypothetical protein
LNRASILESEYDVDRSTYKSHMSILLEMEKKLRQCSQDQYACNKFKLILQNYISDKVT